MFGHRKDGKELKNISPVFKIIPNIMKERSDSQVFFNQDIVLSSIEAYCDKKAEEGIKVSIMDVLFAACVRVLGQRPHINRFAINGRVYARNNITVSITIKKSMTDKGEETTLKVPFTGAETIFEVSEKIRACIEENKKDDNENGTDKLTNILAKTPAGVLKFLVGMFKFLDKRGHLPKSVMEVSPFHTSAFITNVGSLGIDSIYHHLYNFGTTSCFFAMGKKKKSYVYEDDDIKEEKVINLAFVGDERICDGYYYALSFRQLCKYFAKPELLEEPIEPKIDDEL